MQHLNYPNVLRSNTAEVGFPVYFLLSHKNKYKMSTEVDVMIKGIVHVTFVRGMDSHNW